ncbi:MAG TPA: Fe-S protein assembly chaperone HscA [Chitinophagales bacterium]|nr:Fe-S protein assembly chaperone HscA [Chitinophagales bacterium]
MAKISINIKEAKIEKPELIAGIDLGTTNSLIAFVNKETGNAETVKEAGRNSLVPSIVHFDQNGNVTVGSEAKPFLISDPQRTIYSVKRLMGKSYKDVRGHEDYFGYKIIDEDEEKLVKIRVDNKFYSPIELSSFILKELKARAEKVLTAKSGERTEVKRVVITVPAYFNDSQRQATRDAGKLAGLEVLRIINEPTAASLAYGIGLDKNEERTIAVYDLGGGTFDISILKIHPDASGGIFEVLSTNGDTFLGGDDFDRAIVDFWLKKNKVSKEEFLDNKSLSQALRLKAEGAKIFLSNHNQYDRSSEGHPEHFDKLSKSFIDLSRTFREGWHTSMMQNFDFDISRTEFESITRHLIDKTISCVKKALKDAKLDASAIESVVMVGGATRIPSVKKTVSEFFGKEVYDKINPDEVVALGAAIQADVLAGNQKDILLLDVTPLSLGIETMGELMDVIIPRNSKIPTSAARQYTTSKDGQVNMKIAVYQGERDVVNDNRKLAEFILTGIPPMAAGLPKIEISFILNADGILKVRAKELRSGTEQAIEVKPQYGLTDEEVEKMLFDSITHARDDMQARALLEVRTEAQQVLQSAEKFLNKNSELLNEDEVAGIRSHMKALEEVIESSDKDLIHVRLDELNEFTHPFAHRVMDQVISAAMKGKKV